MLSSKFSEILSHSIFTETQCESRHYMLNKTGLYTQHVPFLAVTPDWWSFSQSFFCQDLVYYLGNTTQVVFWFIHQSESPFKGKLVKFIRFAMVSDLKKRPIVVYQVEFFLLKKTTKKRPEALAGRQKN